MCSPLEKTALVVLAIVCRVTTSLAQTPTPTPCATILSENFDGVTALALPAGWTATNASGDTDIWVTSTTNPDTAPNDAFIPDQAGISDKYLISRNIVVTSASALLSFRNNFNTEHDPPPMEVFWNGGVLEVSSPNINNGDFTDVTDPQVGGSFVTGGYTGIINKIANNPLAGRLAWSGNSGGYINTAVNLGPNVNGQTVKLRFRMGTDEAMGAPGWRIDTISIAYGSCPSPTPNSTPTPMPTGTGTPIPTPTPGCTAGWLTGPDFPAVAVVRAVGVYFPTNDCFYVMGGRSAETVGNAFTNPFEYNPVTNIWAIKFASYPDFNVSNMACGVLTVGGTPQIYCVGGSVLSTVSTASARVFSYNPVTDVITPLTAADDWPVTPAGTVLPGGFAVVANKLYIIGGYHVGDASTNQTWQFDPTRAVGSRWTQKVNYPVTKSYIPTAAIGGLIYTAGGTDISGGTVFTDSAISYKYDPVANIYTLITPIPRETGDTRAVVMNNQMWVLGGGVELHPIPLTR